MFITPSTSASASLDLQPLSHLPSTLLCLSLQPFTSSPVLLRPEIHPVQLLCSGLHSLFAQINSPYSGLSAQFGYGSLLLGTASNPPSSLRDPSHTPLLCPGRGSGWVKVGKCRGAISILKCV